MLVFKNISHQFGLERVLNDINYRVIEGSVTGIVGPSGCGKSTLLAIAAGLLEPSEGSVTNTFQRTAMVFQEDCTLAWMNALDNISFGLKAQGMARALRYEKALAIGKSLQLSEDDLNKYPGQLSGGMRQRVALGRALAVIPDLLLLDEPFSALDVGLKRELQDLLLGQIQLRKLTAVFITHDLLEAVKICDQILVLSSGGEIVHQIAITEPKSARNEQYIYHKVAAMLSDAQVQQAFSLRASC